MTKRKSLSKRLRFEIFKRDEFVCQYCGNKPPTAVLEIDHIISVSNGGENIEENLITSCFDCNRGKSDTPLDKKKIDREKLLDLEIKREEQSKKYNSYLKTKRKKIDKSVKKIGTYYYNQIGPELNKYIFGTARTPSIKTFLKKLTEEEMLEAVDISISRVPPDSVKTDHKTWKYFCGVCWRKIKQDREVA